MNGYLSILKKVLFVLASIIIIAFVFQPVSVMATKVTPELLNIGNSARKAHLTEQFGFSIKAYPYGFQRRENVIDIDVNYQYQDGITKPEYPNFLAIKKEIEAYIQNYPDKYQYWEILNKDIATMLAENYSVLENIEVDLTIYPTTEFPIKRHSLVSIQNSN